MPRPGWRWLARLLEPVLTVLEQLRPPRRVRAVTTVEPEWTEDQQAIMLARHLWLADRCRGCGGDLNETTLPANEGRYKPKLPTRCHRCTAFAESEHEYRESRHPTALIHRVELIQGRG